MVNRRTSSSTPEGTSDSVDVGALEEMCSAMDELHRHNWTQEDDVHNIRQYQPKSNPPGEMDVLNPIHSQTRYGGH